MSGLIDPAEGAFAVTPSDSAELAKVSRGIWVGVAGDVTLSMINGDVVLFTNMAAGTVHPLRVRKVFSTGTAATNIVAVY